MNQPLFPFSIYVAIYVIVFVLFLASFFYKKCENCKVGLLLILILGPAVFYPVYYFHFASDANDQERVKKFGELWGPLWAALAVIAGMLWDKWDPIKQ